MHHTPFACNITTSGWAWAAVSGAASKNGHKLLLQSLPLCWSGTIAFPAAGSHAVCRFPVRTGVVLACLLVVLLHAVLTFVGAQP
eukprot:1150154-Pelagomonas_calceolata.AAC.2